MLKTLFSRTNRPWLTWLLLGAFAVAGIVHYWGAASEDLGSSYVGCRLIATGHPEALFSYDPQNFADVGNEKIWPQLARQGEFRGYTHPYVQTPLWAYSLQPLCDHTRFPAFSRWFLVLILLCFAGSIWLVARFWAPLFLHPLPMATILLCFWFWQPFGYAMFLMQTHAVFFFLTIAALLLAERDRPIAAGVLLALAAAVKITPILLVLYWLLTGRWKAVGSAVLTSALLMLLTVLAVGPHLTAEYIADLQRISRVLLVAQNNQSFAAWAMGRFYPPDEVFDVSILPLPAAVRLASLALSVAFTLLGGWIDRTRQTAHAGRSRAPLGAMLALVALTFFAPIAWTHYAVILVAPLMILCEESRRLRFVWLAILAAVITVLNFPPLATDVISMDVGGGSLLRGQFYAAMLCLCGLGVAAFLRTRQEPIRGRSATLAGVH